MFTLAADNPLNHVTDVILWKINGVPVLTLHMITLMFVAVIFVFTMMMVASAIATGPESEGNERYLTKGRVAQMIESMVIYLRDEMLTPVMGEKATARYLPFLMTVFFFILFNNLFGLLPLLDIQHLLGIHTPIIGGTATGNIMVTGALALTAFIMIQLHGIRENGVKGWIMHNFSGLFPGPIYLLPVAILVFFVEIAGHLIKPAALAIRLFANMVAGHTLLAVIVGFGAMAAKGGMSPLGWGGISLISGVAGMAIMCLELFVAFLQAFIFMFLTAVFISLLSHHDEHEEHEPEGAAQPAHA